MSNINRKAYIMSHFFDSGMFVRTPAWHRLGTVTEDWPGSWEDARKLGGLDWEPISAPVFDSHLLETAGVFRTEYRPIEGWQKVARNDTGYLLSIQKDSYKIITNSEFGSVIETVMGLKDDENLKFETVVSIYGGRMIIATIFLDQALDIDGDPSKTYKYIVFVSRHDGQGGLRVIFTNIRVVCANTMGMAERQGERDGTSYVIRHTANWEAKVEEMRTVVGMARRDSDAWAKLARQLIKAKVGPADTKRYLDRFLPISSAMTDRQVTNARVAQDAWRGILNSSTCEHISGTAYGLVMASTEWADHARRARTTDSAVARTLLRAEPFKITAVKIAKELAGVK